VDWLERHLAVFPDPASVLVVGAGRGSDLPVLRRRACGRLILLEPQPRWADFLRRQLAGLPDAEVLEYALDDQSGTGVLKVFNFPQLSSLKPDTALGALLPGARQTSELPVETRSLADLVRQLELQPGPHNWLIVDAPGTEASLLAGLEDQGIRRFFGHVILRTARHGRGQDDAEKKALEEAFRRLEYQPLGDVDSSDGDWPRLHLQHVEHEPRVRELEAEVRSLRQRSRELLADKDSLRERLKEQNLDHLDRTSRLEGDLRHVSRETESRVTALESELAQTRQTLKGQSFELSAAAETHDRQLRQLEGDLEKARDDLAIALRMQALRDADLKDLQARYAETREVRDRQHELLAQLGQRLKAASDYLNALKSSEDLPGGSVLTDSLARVLSGEAESSG
jgi:FkbM family methyltransferase